MENIKSFYIKHKKIIFIIFILLLMILLIYLRFWDFFSLTRIREGDCLIGRMDALEFFRRSVLEYHQFPLWFPHAQGGMPFFAHHIYQVISYPPLVALLIPSPPGMYNFSQLLGILLSGIFMYLLMRKFELKPQYAFISAMFYMFSPMALMFISSHTEAMQVYVWTPLIFLFLWKAVTEKEWVRNSILTGMFLALQFLGNGYDYSLFFVLVFISVFGVYLFGKNIMNRLIKVALISIIILLVTFGLFAVKVIPLLEYHSLTAKSQIESFSYEQSISDHMLSGDIKSPSDLFQSLLVPITSQKRDLPHRHEIKIGFSGLILLLLAFYKFRKKIVAAFLLLATLNLLTAWPTPLWYLFWKFLPMFDAIHHIDRSLFLYCFATSALIGFGASVLFNKLSHKKVNLKIALAVVFALVFVDLFFVTGYISEGRISGEGGGRFTSCFNHNYLLQNLSKDNDIFRIDNIRTKSHAGNAPPMISILGLEMLYGGSGTWFPEMYTYLGLAHSFPAKMYGMLNTKYIYSNDSINITNLRFMQKFEDFAPCQLYEDALTDYGVNGPYLYYNELYLPRAYFAENSIAIIGEKLSVDQTTYSLIIDDRYDPSNTVLIMLYGSIDDYSADFLSRFDSIILTRGSVSQSSGALLNSYISSGGILLPDLTKGENEITEDQLSELFTSFKGGYNSVNKAEFSLYTPNKRIIDIDGETGWLVLAEKFFMFEGWEPVINGEEKLFVRANGINSAVYINGEKGSLVFDYSPKSLRNGAIITFITLAAIMAFFMIDYKKKKKIHN